MTRFWEKVTITPTCWIWDAARWPTGYGAFHMPGGPVYAHRWAWEDRHGPIPEGLVVDHLCRVRRCVNPAHMELVTSSENAWRGHWKDVDLPRRTHCIRGHEFNEENTRITRSGKRRCRLCERIRSAQGVSKNGHANQ